MSRLDSLLTTLACLSRCAAAAVDHQAYRHVQAELEHYREALNHERARNYTLQTRVNELMSNRDHWMAAYEEKRAELEQLREEVAMAKKPPMKPCKKCGKAPCKCK